MTVTVSQAINDDVALDLDIKPLQPTIGAEIGGIDLSRPLSSATRDAIKAALLKYKVVFFRDQALDSEGQAEFARNFGKLYDYPVLKQNEKVSQVHRIAYIDVPDYKDRAHTAQPGDAYHSDTSWRLVPTWGAVLRAVTLPEVGGDTIWVDGNLAYEGLDDDVKVRFERLFVTSSFDRYLSSCGHYYPIVAHPLVRTHRETGQKILWANFEQDPQVLSVELSESRAVLAEVLRQYKRPEFQVRFSWKPGSVAFWDNRATAHYAVRNYGDFPRVLERVLIEDEPLYSGL